MLPDNINEVAKHFNVNWHAYKNMVMQNRLCHYEMFTALNQFLHEHMIDHPFSFVDAGCGDSSSIEPVLLEHSIKKYIGIDIADDVLKMAPSNLSKLNCEKEFIAENMILTVKRLQSPVDIIFSSYAVHHLSYQDKFNFINDCKNKLTPHGFFLMIDGILEENQTREEWLNAYEEYYKELYPEITADELAHCMKHPSTSDYPEQINTFEKMAHTLGWKNFQVLVKIGLLTFMVFSK